MSTAALPRPIDPFRASVSGRYEDDAVVVRRGGLRPRGGERWTAVTEHFAIGADRGKLLLAHDLPPGQVDNDLAVALAEELFAPGWAGGVDTFERLLTGVVLSCHDDPLVAWELFYRASLRRLDDAPGLGFGPVYRQVESLVRGAATRTLLDLGTCFGFLPLRLAAGTAGPGIAVQAADISGATCDLLSRVSVRLGRPVPVLVCDAAAVPLPDAAVDTVTLLHLLEHLDAGHARAALLEAMRLARRRVVVAVPLESEPDTVFGHVRTLDLASLAATGDDVASAGPWRPWVEEFHGGWLVLDRLLPPA